MGFFDIFKGNKKAASEGKSRSTPAAKHAERAGDKRAQTYDRQEAIQNLVELCAFDPKTSKDAKSLAELDPKAIRGDAVAALLRRFTFQVEPSITDQDEKEMAFQGILKAGEDAIDPVRNFAAKAESVAWPMRIFKELLAPEEYTSELIGLLKRWDTEYEKFIDPKLQLLHALEEVEDPRVLDVAKTFLHDVADQARFQAVCAILAQKREDVICDLIDHMHSEESVRVRTRIVDGFRALSWRAPEDRIDDLRKRLPYGYTVDSAGSFHKFD